MPGQTASRLRSIRCSWCSPSPRCASRVRRSVIACGCALEAAGSVQRYVAAVDRLLSHAAFHPDGAHSARAHRDPGEVAVVADRFGHGPFGRVCGCRHCRPSPAAVLGRHDRLRLTAGARFVVTAEPPYRLLTKLTPRMRGARFGHGSLCGFQLRPPSFVDSSRPTCGIPASGATPSVAQPRAASMNESDV